MYSQVFEARGAPVPDGARAGGAAADARAGRAAAPVRARGAAAAGRAAAAHGHRRLVPLAQHLSAGHAHCYTATPAA